MRVAMDATPLLGQPTGVGAFVAGVMEALGPRPGVELSPYTLSLRGRGSVLGARTVPIPAALAMRAWMRVPWPPAQWWTGPVDVVHGTNFVVPPTRRRTGAVVTVHDLTPIRYPDMAWGPTKIFPQLVARAIARGAHVHTPSHFVAGEVIEAFAVPADRVTAVHHGIPALAVSPGPAPVSGPYVLALGTIEPRKGLVSLVRAFDLVADEHDDVRLVVAGRDGWGSLEVERAVVSARHTRRIVRIGYVPPVERAALIANAVVYAYPSVYEGFGLPPLEAMSCGVPVVATTVGALPEVLGDAAEFVQAGDVDELAGALSDLLADGARRATMAEAGRRRATGFTWAKCADGLIDVYRRAA